MECKTCSKCGVAKPFAAFTSRSDSRDGYKNDCRECVSERDRLRYAADPARKLENATLRYLAKGAEIRAKNAERAAANPERRLSIRRQSAEKHAEGRRAKHALYRKQYPEKVRAAGHRIRAKRRQAPGSHTAEDIATLMKLQRGLCVACRCDIRGAFHVDHIEALARGGSNDRRNLQLLCPPCNQRKSARHSIDFMQSKGFLL